MEFAIEFQKTGRRNLIRSNWRTSARTRLGFAVRAPATFCNSVLPALGQDPEVVREQPRPLERRERLSKRVQEVHPLKCVCRPANRGERQAGALGDAKQVVPTVGEVQHPQHGELFDARAESTDRRV